MGQLSVGLIDASGALLAYQQYKDADTPYSSLDYVRTFHPHDFSVSRHAIATLGAEIVSLFSFVVSRERIRILNRLTSLRPEILHALVALIFKEFPSTQWIEFEGVYPQGVPAVSVIPLRAWVSGDDFVLPLPESLQTYMHGSKTLKNLRNYSNRLKRERPSAVFEVSTDAEITAKTVSAVVRLNYLRMRYKGRKQGIDAAYEGNLHELLRQRGVAVTICEGDRILAGALCTRVNSGWSLHVISHDPDFNHLRLGSLCLLQAIKRAVECRSDNFHFLWGESEYKKLFGAQKRDLFSMRCYRTRAVKWLAIRDQIKQVKCKLAISAPGLEIRRLVRSIRAGIGRRIWSRHSHSSSNRP